MFFGYVCAAAEKDTIVWVDIENCGVPSDLNSTELYGLIEQKLGEDGFKSRELGGQRGRPFSG